MARRRPASYRKAVPSALYSRDILRLAASIPHAGRLEGPDASATRTSPLCGSRVTIDIGLDEAGRVAAIGQEVRACALGQAAAALLGAHAIGRSAAELRVAHRDLADFLTGARADPGDWPGLEAFAPARPVTARHASILLAFDAAAAAAEAADATPAATKKAG